MIARNAVIALSLALTGCSWSVFDDLADQAWVDSSERPDDLKASDYGVAVAAGGDTGDGAAFLVAGIRPDGLVQVGYDAGGALSRASELVSANASDPDPLATDAPLVGDPTSSSGAVALGLSEAGGAQGRIICAERGDGGPHVFASISLGTGAVEVIGFGRTNAASNPTTTHLVAVQDDALSLITAYDDPGPRTIDSCRLDREQGFALVLADFDSSSDGQEIALAMGNQSLADAPAELQFLTGAVVEAADASSEQEVNCLTDIEPRRDPLLVLDPPAGEPDFGARLLAGDFDGDGTPDLAVAAHRSNSRVYVYMNIDLASAGPADPIEIAAPAGSASFGDSLAAGDFDGDGDDELVIGDSQITVDGNNAAGRAYVYVWQTSGFSTPLELGDAQPEANQRFGRAMAVATWAGSDPLLVVAATGEIFTYFRTPVPGDTDLRE